MDDNQTLKDALIASGNEGEAGLLSPEAQNLTKQEICDFINGKHNEKLSMGTIASLKKMALQRMEKGQSVFPWKSMPGINSDPDGGMSGGFW